MDEGSKAEANVPVQGLTEASSSQIRISRIVFISAVLLLAATAVLAYISAAEDSEDVHWVDHTYEVMLTTQQFMMDQKDAAGSARGYMLTGDRQFLAPYHAAAADIPGQLNKLGFLIQDNPHQIGRVAQLRAFSLERLRSQLDALQGPRPGMAHLDAATEAELLQSKQVMDRMHEVTDVMIAEEQRLLSIRRETAERGRLETLWIIVVGNVVSLLALLACLWMLTREIFSRRRAEAEVLGLNRELAARNTQLESTNRELEGFSYSISHDLRAPLRAIDGFSQLLQTRYAGNLDAEALRLLDVVRDSSRNMATLIDDLLAFSRMGRKSLETEMLDMPALVGECIAEVLRDQPARPSIVVGPLPHCRGDRTLIRQVWVNLIGNAVKYSGQNPKARVDITGREEARECIYSVHDNGVGFDMQYYHKLFGVFQRLHRAEEFPGTGVGLAISMRAVTKHGGRLWADASLGQGATFLFSLPRTESIR